MATKFLSPGGDETFSIATGGGEIWDNFITGATIVTDIVHGSHVKSIKYAPNTGGEVTSRLGVCQDSGTRINFFVYINALPNATGSLFYVATTGDLTVVKARVKSTGVIIFVDANNVQLGSDGPTLSTGQWYRFSLAYTITSKTINRFEFFVNGVSGISLTNVTLINNISNNFTLGNISGDTTFDIRSSDHYVDDSNALTDPGNIWVIAKRPNTNGTTNGFTTQIGSGGSGYGSGHSPQVNERPADDTNGWSIATVASAITEEYNIENASTGDINISGATIVDYMGWLKTKALTNETGKIIVNGVSTDISITTTSIFFTKAAGSSTYPAGTGADIGITSAAVATTISLYECGIMIAYIPAVATASNIGTRTLLGVGK